MIHVRCRESIPPAASPREIIVGLARHQFATAIEEKLHLPPFVRDQKVQRSVTIRVGPKSARHQARACQSRRDLFGHIREPHLPIAAVVAQNATVSGQRIILGDDPVADEQIEIAVAIKIRRTNRSG
ncbi:MAG TPA: hypothetical protein VNM70_05325, partial [Burkholderiales bacterium]|nr:hypothetical protein [Burkholderiales bacterium]